MASRGGEKLATNRGRGRGPRGDKRNPGSTNRVRGRGVPVWPKVPLLLRFLAEVVVMVAKAERGRCTVEPDCARGRKGKGTHRGARRT